MIPENLLELYQATKKKISKGEVIFREGEVPVNFFQICTGDVKMSNFNDDGKEFVQGFFTAKQSFGEPPLFSSRIYPANAIAMTDVELFVLPKSTFFSLIKENVDVAFIIIENLSNRMHYKAVMAAEISSQEPEHRILKLIDYSIKFFKITKEPQGYRIDFTRQQMADLTGLRVETVIRTLKNLEKKNLLKIINRKVYR
ncbi:MAG: Crp/Fnr family transcriptional regulator [Limnohabitans sp.]|nr:Crp/Fnr family transcriptional regulator [Limnohabitans sp.]